MSEHEMPKWDFSNGQPRMPDGWFVCPACCKWTYVPRWEHITEVWQHAHVFECPECEERLWIDRKYKFDRVVPEE